MRQEQLHQLESTMQRQRHHLHKSQSQHSLLVATEHAQHFVHSTIREELNEARRQLDEERALRVEEQRDSETIRRELQRVRRKLERREHMIAQALSKLEACLIYLISCAFRY